MEAHPDQFVHCLFETVDSKYKGYVTFIYAHNCFDKRKLLWDDLFRLYSSIQLPWIVLGDFNVVIDAFEKISEVGSQVVISVELHQLFFQTDLHDLRYVGNTFTWDNGHTFCKLDMALCNSFWEAQYSGTIVDFATKSISDHSPTPLQVFKPVKHLAHPFRFKNLWVVDLGFFPLVEHCLHTIVTGCAMFRLIMFLKHLKKKNLRSWMEMCIETWIFKFRLLNMF